MLTKYAQLAPDSHQCNYGNFDRRQISVVHAYMFRENNTDLSIVMVNLRKLEKLMDRVAT